MSHFFSMFKPITKRRLIIITALLAMSGIVAFSLFYALPFDFFHPLQKPEQTTPIYDYYIIISEEDNSHLMYVPLTVHIGDEVLSEDNKIYKVVRIEENRAYARFVKNVNLEKFK